MPWQYIGHPIVKPVSIVNTYSCVCALYREEKTEHLIDTKNEIERLDAEIQKLKHEVSHQGPDLLKGKLA